MHILITGGTGLIGSFLAKQLCDLGHKITILCRKLPGTNSQEHSADLITQLNPTNQYYEVIINLAGEPLNKKRWNYNIKQEIYNSRIQTTQKIIDFIEKSVVKPKLLISGSAIGYYGNHPDKIFTEESEPADTGFTHQLCKDWEQTALQATKHEVRVCLIRTGIVLAKNGGALKELMTPFKLGLGAILGDGKQWMSWIDINDVVWAIIFLINNDKLNGVFNLTSPHPVTNKDFSKKLAQAIHRPCFLHLPGTIVKLLFGEMGEKLLLNGQKVVPEKLLHAGFKFKFNNIEDTLKKFVSIKVLP